MSNQTLLSLLNEKNRSRNYTKSLKAGPEKSLPSFSAPQSPPPSIKICLKDFPCHSKKLFMVELFNRPCLLKREFPACYLVSNKKLLLSIAGVVSEVWRGQRDGIDWKGLQAGLEGHQGWVAEEGDGGCWRPRDLHEGLSMSCIDNTAEILTMNFP